MEHGDKAWMIEEIEKRNLPTPKWLTDCPTVPVELIWYWQAFWELDTERRYVETVPLNIPWSAIVKYAEYYGQPVDYTIKLMRKMDAVLIAHKLKKREEAIEEAKRKAPKGKRRNARIKH